MQNKIEIDIPRLNVDEIKAILESGDFNKFLGVREDSVFEFKSPKPYILDSSDPKVVLAARFELARDVVSFANFEVGEGYIILGLKLPSTPAKNTPHDIVGSVDLVAQPEFYQDSQLKEVLETSIPY